MHIACAEGHTSMVRLLLDQEDVDVDRKNGKGETPLEVAWKEEDVRLLLDAGAVVAEDFEEDEMPP